MSFSDNFQAFEREKMIRNGVSENMTWSIKFMCQAGLPVKSFRFIVILKLNSVLTFH